MDKALLNVYDEKGNIVKTCEAQYAHIKFGVIRSLMKLLKIDQVEDTQELMKTVYTAWDKIVKILDTSFPDMTEDDWDNVDFAEVMKALLGITKMTFAKMTEVPRDEKNPTAE